MIRPILTVKEDSKQILRTNCEDVVNPDTIQEVVTNLFDTLDSTDNGVGLSAPQIGVSLRIFVMDYHGVRQAFINPRIRRQSDNETSAEEGCLSLPGVSCRVTRPKMVWIDYTDWKGVAHQNQKFKKMEARIIQHEMDHLVGVLITDYKE